MQASLQKRPLTRALHGQIIKTKSGWRRKIYHTKSFSALAHVSDNSNLADVSTVQNISPQNTDPKNADIPHLTTSSPNPNIRTGKSHVVHFKLALDNVLDTTFPKNPPTSHKVSKHRRPTYSEPSSMVWRRMQKFFKPISHHWSLDNLVFYQTTSSSINDRTLHKTMGTPSTSSQPFQASLSSKPRPEKRESVISRTNQSNAFAFWPLHNQRSKRSMEHIRHHYHVKDHLRHHLHCLLQTQKSSVPFIS